MNAAVSKHFLGVDVIESFTRTSQRPPVPGEENDCHLQHQQPLSNFSTSSSSPAVADGHHRAPDRGGCWLKGENAFQLPRERRPVPIRADRAPYGGASTKLDREDVDAPLGFEPEGGVSVSPHFQEGSCGSGPSYLKWAESLKYLLQDSDGVSLFKQFLDQEQGSGALDFWFACSGLKMVSAGDADRIVGLVKLIYKRYIKGDHLCLKADVKRRIIDRLKRDLVDRTIFDEAQTEIEKTMRNDTYPLFLKSDTYLQYVQTGGESPKPSNDSSRSDNGILPMVGFGQLPPLPEGREIDCDDIKSAPVSTSSLSLTPSALLATRKAREGPLQKKFYG